MTEKTEPPWVAFPDIPWESAGWRMGFGEEYANIWIPWFRSLSQIDRETFRASWPEPEVWVGFYAMIENGTTPPHITEKERRIAAVGVPPSTEEIQISDYHRILWLLRNHFRRVSVERPDSNEVVAEIYEAPSGTRWRLSCLKPFGMQFNKIPE